MEPERKIEKTLRETAAKRREEQGPAFEMHPATRNLLQGEVARQFRNQAPSKRRSPSLFKGFWLRVAWGCALLVVLAGGWLASPKRNPELASNTSVSTNSLEDRVASAAIPGQPVGAVSADSAAAIPPEVASARVPAESPAAQDTLKRDSFYAAAPSPLGIEQKKTLEKTPPLVAHSNSSSEPLALASSAVVPEKDVSALAAASSERGISLQMSAPVAPNTSSPTLSASASGLATDSSTSYSFAGNRKAQTAGADARLVNGPLAANDEALVATKDVEAVSNRAVQAYLTSRGTQSQEFVTLATPAGAKREADAGILTSFKLEQTPAGLRIVDADGSVYSESVDEPVWRLEKSRAVGQAADGGSRTYGLPRADTSKAKEEVGPGSQQVFFRVSGTNLTMKKKIVFSGSIETTSVLRSLPQVTAGSQQQAQRARVPSASAAAGPVLRGSKIRGTAWLEEGKQIEIEAVPARP